MFRNTAAFDCNALTPSGRETCVIYTQHVFRTELHERGEPASLASRGYAMRSSAHALLQGCLVHACVAASVSGARMCCCN